MESSEFIYKQVLHWNIVNGHSRSDSEEKAREAVESWGRGAYNGEVHKLIESMVIKKGDVRMSEDDMMKRMLNSCEEGQDMTTSDKAAMSIVFIFLVILAMLALHTYDIRGQEEDAQKIDDVMKIK